ncbi:hypothetical protein AB0H92_19530 [Streptomyces phaeochromogenes]|uniref:hypothetical protein n=1 Tax=Streptomyces phaeochromogenes TaxID=1923 RepID=UPI0033CFA845
MDALDQPIPALTGVCPRRGVGPGGTGPAAWILAHTAALQAGGDRLDEARAALSSGHVFGAGGARCVRLDFAASPATLCPSLDRMGRAVRDLR